MSGLVRASSAITILLGLGLVVWAAASAVQTSAHPAPLLVTLFLTGALLVALGVGLARRARVAWSFAVTVLGVLSVAGLLAVPAIVRSGFPAVAAGLILAILIGNLAALVMGRDAFK